MSNTQSLLADVDRAQLTFVCSEMQFTMQMLLNRGALPSLAQHYSRKQLLARPSCGGHWCRACSSTRTMETHATGQVLDSTTSTSIKALHKSHVCSKFVYCFQHPIVPGFAARPTSDIQYGLQVISKEANFVTVRVNKVDVASTASPERTDLLCSVRALLKKIKQTVLVGDNVQVASIDWTDKRGMWTDKRGMLKCKRFQQKAYTPSIFMHLLYLL
jgi:hypothetical protein